MKRQSVAKLWEKSLIFENFSQPGKARTNFEKRKSTDENVEFSTFLSNEYGKIFNLLYTHLERLLILTKQFKPGTIDQLWCLNSLPGFSGQKIYFGKKFILMQILTRLSFYFSKLPIYRDLCWLYKQNFTS